MSLRHHQREMRHICEQIRAGAPIKRIVCNVTCGGGKALLPMVAAATLEMNVCWIVPRTSLQTQAEETFQDPVLRELCGYSGPGIRKSTNEKNPARGRDGFVTTYQACGLDTGELEKEIHARPYVLVCDEFSHLHEDAVVASKILLLAKAARVVVLMSGTIERHGGERISFLDYQTEKDGEEEIETLDLSDKSDLAVITYGRTDALAEKAIIPLKATYLDAKASWQKDGRTVSVDSIRTVKGQKASRALFTALKTEYAVTLLNDCVNDWVEWKKDHPESKMLVVAPSQDEARRYAGLLKQWQIPSGLAISDDGPLAQSTLKKFRRDDLPALVTVGMCYEGLDVPAITHLAILTKVRSKPWLEQALARATRFNRSAGPWESQTAHIFCPDDFKMRSIIDLIEKEQAAVIKKKAAPEESVSAGGTRDLFGDLIMIGSSAHGKRSQRLFSVPAQATAAVITPSEQEQEVRDQIERHVRAYAMRKKLTPHSVNGLIKGRFKKSRQEMSLPELEKVQAWVRGTLR